MVLFVSLNIFLTYHATGTKITKIINNTTHAPIVDELLDAALVVMNSIARNTMAIVRLITRSILVANEYIDAAFSSVIFLG